MTKKGSNTEGTEELHREHRGKYFFSVPSVFPVSVFSVLLFFPFASEQMDGSAV
jgi:hypothetical protein